jgi:cyclopropane fatty-acyl-phospholipid synthase-like methyltransferase
MANNAVSRRNTADAGLKTPAIDRNSVLNILLIAASLFVGFVWSPWGFLIWPLGIIIDDLVMIFTLHSLFDPEIAIKRGYQFGHVFLEKTSGYGRDLGFNLYDGDLSKENARAQEDKWQTVYNSLGLKPGDRVIDVGCGYGDWLNYLQERGHDGVGVNITPEQAEYARETYGLDVVCRNWKDILHDRTLQEKLYGKFDAVTFMDTVEHYVAATDKHTPKAAETYSNMFAMAHKLIRPDSRTRRIFISCLHFHQGRSMRKRGFKLLLSVLLLIRYHSGSYPTGSDGLSKYASKYFDEIGRWDRTEDYRLTGVLDNAHFQAPKIHWTPRKLLLIPYLFLLDPHHIHKWIDIKYDAWFNLYGDDAYERAYDPEGRFRKSFVVLWWLLFEDKRIQAQQPA